MIIKDEVAVEADIDHVWNVFTDVERWPQWTESVSTARVVDGGRLEMGTRVRMKQPRLPAMEWVVTSIDVGRSWTWVASRPGVQTAAMHVLQPVQNGTTRVVQTIEQSGLFGAIAGRLTAGLTRRYLEMEGCGLKARCESLATS